MPNVDGGEQQRPSRLERYWSCVSHFFEAGCTPGYSQYFKLPWQRASSYSCRGILTTLFKYT